MLTNLGKGWFLLSLRFNLRVEEQISSSFILNMSKQPLLEVVGKGFFRSGQMLVSMLVYLVYTYKIVYIKLYQISHFETSVLKNRIQEIFTLRATNNLELLKFHSQSR